MKPLLPPGRICSFMLLFFCIAAFSGCIKQDHSVEEECYSDVRTRDATDITHAKATLNASYALSIRPGTTVKSAGFYFYPTELTRDTNDEDWTFIAAVVDEKACVFDSDISGLEPETEYLFYAYLVSSSENNAAKGEKLKFTTPPLPEVSTVATLPATAVSYEGATLNAEYFLAGGDEMESFGFEYWLTSDPDDIRDGVSALKAEGEASFSEAVTPIAVDNEHSFSAYIVTAAEGKIYGETFSFTPYSNTVVTTGDVSDVTLNSLTFHGCYVLGGNAVFKSAGFRIWEEETELGTYPAGQITGEQFLLKTDLNPGILHKYQAFVILGDDSEVTGEVKEYIALFSEPPVINDVYMHHEEVTGTGIAGSVITVTFPSGVIITLTVASDNTWICNIPGDIWVGDQITAYQIESGKFPSENVSTIVRIAKSELPEIDEIYNNETVVEGRGVPGAQVIVTIPGGQELPTMVDSQGRWEAQMPSTQPAGSAIYARQAEPKKEQSDQVMTLVLERPMAVSAPPEFDEIWEYDPFVSGKGVPAATICVRFFDNSMEYTTVGPDGRWSLTPPMDLFAGDLLFADQTEDGKMTSDEIYTVVLARPRQSARPVIDDVWEGDPVVNGSGVPMATIYLRFFDGTTLPATVGSNGRWTVVSPFEQLAGDLLTATQIEPDKTPSEEVFTVVLARQQLEKSAPPVIERIHQGAVSIMGSGIAGSTITVTLPDGSTVKTEVLEQGWWEAFHNVRLYGGQRVEAYQTEPGKLDSDPTYTYVIGAS